MDWTFSNVSFVKQKKNEASGTQQTQNPPTPTTPIVEVPQIGEGQRRRHGREFIPSTVSVCEKSAGYVTHWKIDSSANERTTTPEFGSGFVIQNQVQPAPPNTLNPSSSLTTYQQHHYYYSQPQDISSARATEIYQHSHDPPYHAHQFQPHAYNTPPPVEDVSQTIHPSTHERSQSLPVKGTVHYNGINFHYFPITASHELLEFACDEFTTSLELGNNNNQKPSSVPRSKVSIQDLLRSIL
jgi:hypothetical protein